MINAETKYLIIGGSHAGLSAAEAIRQYDYDGKISIVNKEDLLPYSPTVLPYIISDKVTIDQVCLRNTDYFKRNNIDYKTNKQVQELDIDKNLVTMKDGQEVKYNKLLIASGASPSAPPIEGLSDVPYHVLRTFDDARKIKEAMSSVQSCIVLGAGLIGLHAAENMVKAGINVTIIEKLEQVLPGYFDNQAAGIIQTVMDESGIRLITRKSVVKVSYTNSKYTLSLDDGSEVQTELLIVATGVKTCLDFCQNSSLETQDGILVNDLMRTNVDNIWAAGDVAQAKDFFGLEKVLNGILPDAVEQGYIAGMSMSEDPAVNPYVGGIPMNTYTFFGNRSFTVGLSNPPVNDNQYQIDILYSPASLRFQKFIFYKDKIVGCSAINIEIDPGIIRQIIKRQIELGQTKRKFVSYPQETGRILMSNLWQ